jgi:hypothetical protein
MRTARILQWLRWTLLEMSTEFARSVGWRKPDRAVGQPVEAHDHAIWLTVYAHDHARPPCEVTEITAGH